VVNHRGGRELGPTRVYGQYKLVRHRAAYSSLLVHYIRVLRFGNRLGRTMRNYRGVRKPPGPNRVYHCVAYSSPLVHYIRVLWFGNETRKNDDEPPRRL
jgi:hypothetical protein